ncbi:MAG: hypothetical protein ACREIU_14385, partial [Planctomycetota bacterium]
MGTTVFEVQGAAPNRRIVVEWNNLEHFFGNFSGENATFQAVINETTNVLEYHYDNATFTSGGDAWNATVGTENFNGTQGDDLTCLGDSNAVFPATGFILTPGVPPPPTPTPIPPPLAGNAAAYNQGNLGNYTYNTGAPNEGTLVSPPFCVPAGGIGANVTFDYLKETEGGGSSAFDQCFVEARPSPTDPWTILGQISGNQPCGLGGATTTVSGTVIPSQLRLRFDTVDSVGNDYLGWYVDNLSMSVNTLAVANTAGTGCPSSSGCVPSILACGTPTAGGTFSVGLANAQPGTIGVLILAAGTTSIPVSLFIPGNTCTLLVPLVILISPIPIPAGGGCSGTASIPISVPCGFPAGVPFNAQWAVVQPGIF